MSGTWGLGNFQIYWILGGFGLDLVFWLWYNNIMNITQAILKLRIQYAIRLKLHPADINAGLCMDFAAKIAKQGFGDDIWGNEVPIEYWTDAVQAVGRYEAEYFMEIHCFIYYDGKFYDSETPQGCDYPDDLLCYQRNMDLLNIADSD